MVLAYSERFSVKISFRFIFLVKQELSKLVTSIDPRNVKRRRKITVKKCLKIDE
jgi:hypothetical protein